MRQTIGIQHNGFLRPDHIRGGTSARLLQLLSLLLSSP